MNRRIPRDGEVNIKNREALTSFFGTHDWEQALLRPSRQRSLFGEVMEKAPLDVLGDYVVDRLATVFPGVSRTPVVLKNSIGAPMYRLCFAIGNPDPKAMGLALKLADHITAKASKA